MITGYTYTIWERIQIRGKEEESTTLNLYIRGIGSKWQRAGRLKNKENKWIFQPVRTSDAPDILTAILIKFLT
ncbi:MAG: hypothetical protein J7647_06450 [Cyanobacteria bacterium SBLK]|nr:hypothetical protein [Cyanobacteria bacterium SBLK]